MAVGEDALWVGSVGDGSVYRIDPTTNTVERIDLGWTKQTENWDLLIEATPGAIWLRRPTTPSPGSTHKGERSWRPTPHPAVAATWP